MTGRELVVPGRSVAARPDFTDEPSRKELILTGRAALADLGHDPDDWVDAETEEELRQATPENTIAAVCWGWGRLIWYCGKTSRRHDPPTAATMRQYIKDHWHMTYSDGKKRGRRGQPYAWRTVELAVYTVAMVCNRMDGWSNPVRNPKVHDQLKRYRDKWEDAGFRTDEADPLSPAQSVALARCQDLGTVNGLRNATLFRLQFDTGCRASELCAVQIQDLDWVDEHRVLITFVKTKGHKPRTVGVQAVPRLGTPPDDVPHPDWDVDPVRLLTLWWQALRSSGYRPPGPLFREVRAGGRRKDFTESGVYGGKILPIQMTYKAYEDAFNRAVTRSGVDRNPKTGDQDRHITTHSNRAGFITAYADAGYPVERAAARTGHSPASPVIHRYFRSGRQWDGDNPGVAIRRVTPKEN